MFSWCEWGISLILMRCLYVVTWKECVRSRDKAAMLEE